MLFPKTAACKTTVERVCHHAMLQDSYSCLECLERVRDDTKSACAEEHLTHFCDFGKSANTGHSKFVKSLENVQTKFAENGAWCDSDVKCSSRKCKKWQCVGIKDR